MGVTIPLSTSSAAALRKCEQQFVYSDVENLQPITASVPLKRGSWMHLLLAAYYASRVPGSTIPHWTAVHAEMSRTWAMEREIMEKYGIRPTFKHEAMGQDVVRMMDGYLFHYTKLAAERGWEDFEVLAVEQAYEFPIKINDDVTVTMRATGDVLGRDREGRLFVMENKTGVSFPYSSSAALIEPQVTAQMLAARANGVAVEYGVYNWVSSRAPSRAILTKKGAVTKQRRQTDLHTFLQVLRENNLDPYDDKYAEKIGELSDPDRVPFYKRVMVRRSRRVADIAVRDFALLGLRAQKLRQRPDRAVRTAWPMVCQMCIYRDLCEADLQGAGGEVLRETRYTTRTDDRTLLRLELETEGR